MKFFKAALVATALTGFAATANAQDAEAYGAIGADFVSVDDFDFVTATAKLGVNLNDNFGIEGQAAIGVDDDSTGAEIDSSFAAFGVARLPLSEQFDVFARAGYHFTDTTFGNEDGFAFGGGIQYNLDMKNGIRAEYTNLDTDFGNADSFGISYVRKF